MRRYVWNPSAGGGAPEMSAVYEYGPFGEPLRATGPLAKANPVRFSSELLDTATGCYYYGYRYYNPDTGRWLSRDPIGEQGGVNLYGAAQNDLINHNDVLGLAFLNFDSPALTLWTGSGFDQSSKKTRCGNPVRTWKAVSGGSDKPPVPGGWYLLTRFMALGDEMPNELNVRSERSFWRSGIYWQGTMAAWDGLAGEEFGAGDPVNPYPGFDLLYGYRPKRSEARSDIERKNVEYKIGLRGTYGNMVPESSAYRIHPKDRTVTSGCIGIQGYLHSTSFLSEVEGSVGAITLYVGRLNCCDR